MRINLLPEELRPQKKVQASSLIILLIIAVSVVTAWTIAVMAFVNNQSLTSESTNINVRLNDLKTQIDEAKKYDQIFQEIEKLQNDAKKINALYQPSPQVARRLASVLLDDMWLTEVSIDKVGKIKIKGGSVVFPQMGVYLDRLTSLKYFKDPHYIGMRREKNEQLSTYTFELETETGRNSLEYQEK